MKLLISSVAIRCHCVVTDSYGNTPRLCEAREGASSSSGLALDDPKVHQSERQEVRELRGTRDQGLRAVAQEFCSVPRGHGPTSSWRGNRRAVALLDRSHRQRRRLRAGQLSVGYVGTTSDAHITFTFSELRRRDQDRIRMGTRTWHGPANAAEAIAIRLVHEEGNDGASAGKSRTAQSGPAVRILRGGDDCETAC